MGLRSPERVCAFQTLRPVEPLRPTHERTLVCATRDVIHGARRVRIFTPGCACVSALFKNA
eukprot:scaffold70365_cov63-Phaeocystis_antarctica.AAC.2